VTGPQGDSGLDIISEVTNEPTGHLDRFASSIDFDDTTRTFSISPVGASFTVWVKGKEFIINTTYSLILPNVTSLYYIAFDETGNLIYTVNYFDFENTAPTAYVYWNSVTQSATFFADERHGTTMDWQTHEYLHRTRGASFARGFQILSFDITGNGDLDTHSQISLEGGTFFDEDVQVDISHSPAPVPGQFEQILQPIAQIPMVYRLGDTWTIDPPTSFPVKQGSQRIQKNTFNGVNWVTEDVANNQYTNTWVVATNNLEYPILCILDQNVYQNVNEAAETDLFELELDGLPLLEFRTLYRLTWLTANNMSNTPHCALRGYTDNRVSFVPPVPQLYDPVIPFDYSLFQPGDLVRYDGTSFVPITGFTGSFTSDGQTINVQNGVITSVN
jgi:hypothetical protein